ncbi:SCA7, zinc-binding domain-containing protein [Hypoxylon rubiginosum]|uniref:SCA7, zinc-binding domain-containing protein n=1 Tax=Hypoxylon rubiginosum TaxID=110542 RepID=A0ACB9YKA9_9PEZI|nr:SCA7, zinc-binding domain-containing protein [Hypoxylon rubiginosum]
MATGTEGRKGPDDEGTINVASKKVSKSKSNGTIKLKKPPPKQMKPGNWRDGSVLDDSGKKARSTESPPVNLSALSPSLMVNPLDETSRETFATGRPLEDKLNLQQCKHCKKGIIKTAAKAHIAQCLRIKKEKAQRKKEAREARERAKEQAREEEARKNDEDGDAKMRDDSDDDDEGPVKKSTGGKATKKVGGKKPDGEPKGKKRKADGDAEKGPKSKKKKEEPKPKVPKPKGPVDVEKQCGVILPNGQPCARSLTCKSHSMGAKRAVAGRSLPYDMLLAAYQKKNQAKQQKAALDANAPLEDDDDANAGPVDSDEETAAVMGALSRWNPQPVLPQPIYTPIRRTYQLARLHEQLQTATNGGRTNIFKVVGYGAQKLPDNHADISMDLDDAPGEPDLGMMGPRSSSFSMQAPSRRPSVASRA